LAAGDLFTNIAMCFALSLTAAVIVTQNPGLWEGKGYSKTWSKLMEGLDLIDSGTYFLSILM
jgi:hypothetical protein